MTAHPSRSVRWLSLAGLIALVAVAYSGLARNGSILLDDPAYVFENELVRRGWTADGIAWALRTGHATNWHPVTWLAHMTVVELVGLDPRGHHLASLVLHALGAVLAVLVFHRLAVGWWASVAAAALYALHPLRVESVAWIAELKDLLGATFFLATLLAWLAWLSRARARPAPARYALAVVLYAVGLMSKPTLVTLPCVLLLVDHWPLRRVHAVPLERRVFEKAPFFILALASCVVTYAVQRAGGAVTGSDRLSFAARSANAALAYVAYLFQSVWPAHLAVHYPHPVAVDWTSALGAIAVLAAITWACVRVRRTHSYALVGWLWFLGTLVPMIGLVQVGQQAHADRYTLLPHLGLCLAVGAALDRASSAGAKRAAGAATAIVIAACVFATRREVAHWRDTRTLFERALAVGGESAFVLKNLGNARLASGDGAGATASLERAVELDPLDKQSLLNLGGAYAARGDSQRAIECCRRAIAITPDDAEAHYDLGLALAQSNRTREALASFERAFELDATHYRALARAATARATLGQRDLAIDAATRAAKIARDRGFEDDARALERSASEWHSSAGPREPVPTR